MSPSSTPRPRIRRARPGARGHGITLVHRWRLQRSIVTCSYSRNTRGASWAAHASYLARGARRDGAKGLGFDAVRDDVNLTATCRGWQKAGDVRLWKFVVSPEHGARLDLRAHTRALVEQLERDLGTRVEWAAVEHHNTAHPHVHLVVRGRAEERPLEIAFSYLSGGLAARPATRRPRGRAHPAAPRLPLVVTARGARGQSKGRAIAGDGSSHGLEDAASRLHRVQELPAVGRADGAGSAGVGDVASVSGRVPERGGRQISAETRDTATTGPSGLPADIQAPASLLPLAGMSRTFCRAI